MIYCKPAITLRVNFYKVFKQISVNSTMYKKFLNDFFSSKDGSFWNAISLFWIFVDLHFIQSPLSPLLHERSQYVI
jgi:hypothetical protein